MQKWLLFFRPVRIAPSILKTDSFGIPFGVYMALTLLSGLGWILPERETVIQKMGAQFYNINLFFTIILGPFFPLIAAALFHFAAKKMTGLDGSLRRLSLLFYYSGSGKSLCGLLIFLVTQATREAVSESPADPSALLTSGFLFPLLPGLALGGYSLYVDLRLLMDNYSIPRGTAVRLMIYFGLLLFALIVIFGIAIGLGALGHDPVGGGAVRV